MKDSKSKNNRGKRGLITRIIPYALVFVAIFALMLVGSRKDYTTAQSSVIMHVINDDSFVVTADQLSESYIIAELANTLELPSADSVSADYVSVALNYALAGTVDSGIIEKPNIIDTSDLSRGIKSYIVVSGDTLAAIAARNHVTTQQIRWSNNMRNETLSVGQRLYIPSVPGILYTVKGNDTIEGLAEKYKSNASQIISYNDLETSGLVAGKTIILPNGELPEKERPEYVAPVARPALYSSIVQDSGGRHDMREVGSYSYWYNLARSLSDGNRNTSGQCTWFAWYWRQYDGRSLGGLPGEVLGHAYAWARSLSARGYVVNNVPQVGAVVQTSTSGYGHVGVVVGVVQGQYIMIQEMNFNRMSFRVFESRVNWGDAVRWLYIH